MKGFKKYGIWLAILFVLYIITKLTAPVPTSWEETLRDNDKNPYGTYILRKSLPSLFPDLQIQNTQVPFYNFSETVDTETDTGTKVYIALAPRIEYSAVEVSQLLAFVRAGNYALISSENFGNRLWDSLGVRANTLFFNISDSSRVNLSAPDFRTAKGYSFYAQTIDNYFDSFPQKYPSVQLGYIDQSQQTNFMRVDIGKGALLLHASPLCFSNAFILRDHNYRYVQQVFSYIPTTIHTVYWDEYYSKGGEEEAQTPFRYFLSNFWLRTGFYLATLLLILYALFAGKRRQRLIPVIAPPRNTTAQFIETISALYYNQKSGPDIFEKKIQHWLAYIRQHLQLPTDDLSQVSFWEKLAAKSGVEITVLHDIKDEIAQLQNHYSDKIFMDLYQNIQSFYQQTSK